MNAAATLLPPLRRAHGDLTPAERRQALFLQASPFLLVREVNELFGGGERAALERLESGKLRAIDISSAWPESGRRELRIYRYSVGHCLMSREPLAWLAPDAILLGAAVPLRRPALAALLRCTSGHLAQLARVGALPAKECPRGTAEGLREVLPITLPQALFRFLEEREVLL